MPPLPMGPQQPQGPHLDGDSAVEGILPGAPEASPPLHTHSSKFPIEREVIVSSAEKTSDTFKAKIPLIQDYGKRLVGGVVGGGGGGGGGMGGVVRGGVGTSTVAPDAPVKQMAWTEAAGKGAGRKMTPNVSQQQQQQMHHHHHHHKPPPNTHVHGGIYGQHFQSPDLHNRQLRDSMTPHHYNGQQMGAIPRREWSNSALATGDDGHGHRSHGEYVQSHQQSARNDSGITWSTPNTKQSQAVYGSVQVGSPKVDSALEDAKGEYAVGSSGAQQKLDEVEVDHSRTDFDVEANVTDGDKCMGRLSSQQQPSSKAFPSRTYHHIKDMISSRFGGGSKGPRDGGAGGTAVGGDAEGGPSDSSAASARGGKEGRLQGLNNSGCRSIPNLNEVSSSRQMPGIPQQPSNRKSNNLGERDDGHQRMMEGGGAHYQQAPQQFRKTDNNSGRPGGLVPGGKEQCVDEPQGGVRRDQMHQYQWAGSPAGDDYGQTGARRVVRRDELGRHDGSERLESTGQQSSEKRREESGGREESVLRGESGALEFSMGSMGIGEPAFYSTPVGEQGKQNNSKFGAPHTMNSSEGGMSASGVQGVRQQHGPGSSSFGGQSNPGHPPTQGFSSSKSSGGAKGRKEERGAVVEGGALRGGPQMAGGRGEGSTLKGGGGEGAEGERREEEGGGFLCQEGVAGGAGTSVDIGSAGGSSSMGGGSSDYEKATHRSGRSTSTDSGHGTAGHGMASRKGTPHEDKERRGSIGGGLDSEGARLDGVGGESSTMHHPGSRTALYGHGGQHSVHDTEWVDVVESELQQILDPKLHSMDGGYGMTMSGVANSVVSESMSMTPPLPPLSPGGSPPPSSPLCARKDRGKHYKLSSSMPYINKSSGQMEQKLPGSHMVSGHHVVGVGQGKGGPSSRLYQAISHPSGISVVKGRQQERIVGGAGGRGPSMEGVRGGWGGGGGWAGSGRGSNKGSTPAGFGDRGRTPMRKEQQYHGGPSSSVKAMLGNAIPLASFGAPPGFDNGDMTSTTTGLDLDSMLDGPTENTSEEDMSATIDTTDAHAIRKQLEGLENMYSEVLKLLGVKKHGSRYQPSDPRINKRRMYGSLSSLPSSASSRPVRDKRRHEDRKKVKDIKGINKRFQRLESHVVTLARSVAHLSSEMRTQHLMMQEIETMRGEIAQLRAQPMRSPSVPWLTAKAPIEKDSFCNNVPALTNPDRVKKLTKFFGDEPPLLRIFLKKLGYEKYASAFEHERIGLVELPYLTEERLQKMGIPMGPRLRILQEAQLSFCQENMSVYVV